MRTSNRTGIIGRPKDQTKREAILDAARTHFLADGFVATRVETIAATANVSKVTVYGHFGDKGAILEAMVEREVDRMGQAAFFAEPPRGDFAAVLTAFGEAMLALLTSPDVQAFERLLGAEASQDPAMYRRFFAAGPSRTRDFLAFIIQAHAPGALHIPDPLEAAEDLAALWLGGLWRDEVRLGLKRAPGPGDLRARAKSGVAKFLKLYAQPGAQKRR